LLHAAQALSLGDPVDAWQAATRARLRQMQGAALKPKLQLYMSFGFVLFAAAIGSAGGVSGAAEVVVVAASVLATAELARACLARLLGRSSQISLSIVGGHTDVSGPEMKWSAAVGSAVIGSGANLALAFAAFAAARALHDARNVHLLHQLSVVHAAWAIAQLLPFIPFRAGVAVAGRLSSRQRQWHAIGSAFLAMNLTLWAFGLTRAPAVLVVFGCAAFAALKAAREAYAEIADRRSGVEASATEARTLLLGGDARRAVALARRALEAARTEDHRRKLWTTLAWAGIAQRDPFLAHTALLQLPNEGIDTHLLASYLNACNRVDEALSLLQDARSFGERSVETSKLLIDLLFARGDLTEARGVAQADAALLAPEDRRALDAALA
jgi:hypothetical protein